VAVACITSAARPVTGAAGLAATTSECAACAM
jgi:hypothetical protein